MSLTSTRPTTDAAEPDRPIPVVVAVGHAVPPESPPNRRRLVLRVFGFALAVAVVVMVGGGLVAKALAEGEAIRNVTLRTDSIALDTAEPALGDDIARGSALDVRRLGTAISATVHGSDIARIKVWSADGTIVYSNEPRLVGKHFGLDDEERETLARGGTQAEISDLDEPENRYERGSGPLLEVYRAIHTPNGTPLLFEVYYRYNQVLTSSEHIWLGFVAVIGASLALLLLALLPLMNGLVRSVERAREERELSLLKALDASDAERRRIAATVHDGPVQDLVGASYRLGAVAATARGTELAPIVAAAESAINNSVDGLRSMLVDLYPASLSEGGIRSALTDLVGGARSRGAVVILRVDDDLALTPEAERLLFRVARETIGNAVKHGGGSPVTVEVRRDGREVVLTVGDRGAGFDAAATLRNPPTGHFGMRLLQDAVGESGVDATLGVESSAGGGTIWRLALSTASV